MEVKSSLVFIGRARWQSLGFCTFMLQRIYMYQALVIDRENCSIQGVVFPNLAVLEETAHAIGSNMFEGFIPTAKSISLIRDYILGELSLQELVFITKSKAYV